MAHLYDHLYREKAMRHRFVCDPASADVISDLVTYLDRVTQERDELRRELELAKSDCQGILQNQCDLTMLSSLGFERVRDGNVTQWFNRRAEKAERELAELQRRNQSLTRRCQLLRDACEEKAGEAMALTIQKLQLEAEGSEVVVIRQRDNLKNRLVAKCSEANELRRELAELREQVRSRGNNG